MHPNSLANLSPSDGFRALSKEQRKANADAGNAAKSRMINLALEERAKTMDPVEALRLGMRVGYNRSYQRWRNYATKMIQQAFTKRSA